MIKASELRVGNWVLDEYTQVMITEILSKHVNHSQAFNCPFDDLEPIPLTPQLLSKCGFAINGDYWYLNFKRECDDQLSYLFVSKAIDDPKEMWYYGFQSPLGSVNINNVYYLHQIQNIIFSLSYNELNYQP